MSEFSVVTDREPVFREAVSAQQVNELAAENELLQAGLQRRKKDSLRGAMSWLFFPAALLYHELLLHFFDSSNDFFTEALLPIFLFSIAGGLALRLFLCIFPGIVPRRIISGIISGLWTVLVGTEYCLKSYFKIYFGVGYICHMTSQVVGDFGGTMIEVILERIPFILLDLIPFVCLMIWGRRIVKSGERDKNLLIVLLTVMILCQGGGSLWGNFGTDKLLYRANYTTDAAIPRFGLLSTIRLEGEYALFGMPQIALEALPLFDEIATDHPERDTYGSNAMDIDFAKLYAETDSAALKAMYQYYSNRTPSQKNEYTGVFAGKNLILLTAESFSSAIIDKDLTPTLYRLTHTGFVFTDSYQPGWGQSTTGGEYAVMTGLIPTWVNNNLSFYASARDYMPFALGNQFSKIGYVTKAYHNNTYNYYNRDLTHPNLGYDYHGVGTGLTFEDMSSWPYSDTEMFQQTLPDCIRDYKATGIPFHTYYMTVSGHANWGWGNSMADKHREAAVAAYPDASQTVQGYVAANLELEEAMTYMVDALEEAGILDDTVICLMADHYPYAMVTETADYYNELRGIEDTERDISRYKNALILWNSAMDTVTVNTPCSSIDIVPTLSNLFGLEFDSRLLSGHDILATNYAGNRASNCMPLVILPGPDGSRKSWVTAAGSYDAYTGEFTANPGTAVDEGYVDSVNLLVELQYSYARSLIQYDFYNLVLGDTAGSRTTVQNIPQTPPEQPRQPEETTLP